MVEPSIKIRISCFSFFRISHRVQTQQICGILFHCRKTWFVFEHNSMGMWINIYISKWLLNMMGMSMKHTMSNQKKAMLEPAIEWWETWRTWNYSYFANKSVGASWSSCSPQISPLKKKIFKGLVSYFIKKWCLNCFIWYSHHFGELDIPRTRKHRWSRRCPAFDHGIDARIGSCHVGTHDVDSSLPRMVLMPALSPKMWEWSAMFSRRKSW